MVKVVIVGYAAKMFDSRGFEFLAVYNMTLLDLLFELPDMSDKGRGDRSVIRIRERSTSLYRCLLIVGRQRGDPFVAGSGHQVLPGRGHDEVANAKRLAIA